jgi:hypothetical protein
MSFELQGNPPGLTNGFTIKSDANLILEATEFLSLNASDTIWARSPYIDITATTGDINLSAAGAIDLSGTRNIYSDTTLFVDAQDIAFEASGGNVRLINIPTTETGIASAIWVDKTTGILHLG